MRFFVFVDLIGTLVRDSAFACPCTYPNVRFQILPATVVYVRISWFIRRVTLTFPAARLPYCDCSHR